MVKPSGDFDSTINYLKAQNAAYSLFSIICPVTKTLQYRFFCPRLRCFLLTIILVKTLTGFYTEGVREVMHFLNMFLLYVSNKICNCTFLPGL